MSLMRKNLLAVMAVCFTIAGLWLTNISAVLADASWQDVVSEAKAGNYSLITLKGLLKKYNAPDNNLLIVDTRQEWEFRTGHIKGAVNFPMEPTWLSRWQNRTSLEKFLGPDKNRAIIFY